MITSRSTTRPETALIIPVHNRRDHTLACLNSLGRVEKPRFSAIIVDDGSSDGTAGEVKSRFPDVTILRGEGNLWWAGAVNLGIRYALEKEYRFIGLVNNDNTFAPDFLENLMACLRQSGAEAACSRVINRRTGDLFFGGGILHPLRGLRMKPGKGDPPGDLPRETTWCGGMGVLFKAEVFRIMGLFDEKKFPQYYADADFCLRLRYRGGRLMYCPAAVVTNNPDSTGVSHRSGEWADLGATLLTRRSHLNLVSTWRFYFRHGPWLLFPLLPARILRVCGGFLRQRLRRRKE